MKLKENFLRMPINLTIYDKENCFFFALGRNAMYAACLSLGLKPDDEVLTPAFDCDSALQPFKALRYKLKFYQSDPYNFSVDIKDIRAGINRNTKLIHIINHFGMPQPWDDILALRREIGIPILEDNAYSLFSNFNNKPLGTFGDMAIFSLRKNLPMVDGGMLRINNPIYKLDATRNNARWCYPGECVYLLSILMNNLKLNRAGQLLNKIKKKIYPSGDPSVPLYSDDKGYPPWLLRDVIGPEFSCDYLRPMSKLARYQLNRITSSDYNATIEKKRFYYHWLAERLAGINQIKVLWPKLPEGVVPFGISFLIPKKRDAFYKILRENYNVIMAWPIFSRLVLDQLVNFPDVEILGRQLLQINLPANQVTSDNFLGYLENLTRDIYNLAKEYL